MTTIHITKISDDPTNALSASIISHSNVSHLLFFVFSLLHPLTPRGKIAYLGLEGLKASSALIEEATKHEKNIILRDEIFRVALNDDHVSALKQAKLALPNQTQWLESDELEWATPTLLGALRIHSS